MDRDLKPSTDRGVRRQGPGGVGAWRAGQKRGVGGVQWAREGWRGRRGLEGPEGLCGWRGLEGSGGLEGLEGSEGVVRQEGP